MSEALSLVNAEYGSDGVILHTRTYKRGGLLGIGARSVVEVTAAKGKDIGRQRLRHSRRDRLSAPSVEPTAPTAGQLIKQTYAAARAEFEKTVPVPTTSQVTASELPVMQPHDDLLAAEMRTVKRMISRLAQQQDLHQRVDRASSFPESLFDRYLKLIEQDVTEELAHKIVSQVQQRLEQRELGDDRACHDAVRKVIADQIPTDDQLPPAGLSPDGRPRTIALVGPTGVGKTTTIAKLAATFKLKQNKRVALVTADTYRIAAVDQLRTYAGIIGVPLQVVASPSEITRSMEAFSDYDVVLIDTAGRSQRDDHRLEELSSLLKSARPHDVHLVLSSTCTRAVLLEAVERFNRIRTDSIIFTKLDEAVTFGVLLNVTIDVNKRLSYLTTGQEVPHQIELGRAERLADLVMGESTAGSSDPLGGTFQGALEVE